ncbi:MAG TPA: hypothetical protein DCQ64_19595 [Candidatus Rokubacteria bacterium]|nr:MAG: hypothetical protein A2X53_05205 [Candidatus Rokubacteria bacterium GWA2_70_23]HAM57491.1 hypothetical protein [Candidatus Rokubacteria bacterium]
MNRKRVAPKPGEALRPATRTAAPARQGPGLYGDLVGGIADVLEAARRASARAVNAIMTATYWEIGRRIVEHEQQGKARAEYGEDLLKRLATDLSARFGRGFGWRNLFQMRAFYLMYPPEKLQTASAIYRTVLPDEKLIAADLQKTRRMLERRGLTEGGKR